MCIEEQDSTEGNGLNPLGTLRDPVEHARIAPPRGKEADCTMSWSTLVGNRVLPSLYICLYGACSRGRECPQAEGGR